MKTSAMRNALLTGLMAAAFCAGPALGDDKSTPKPKPAPKKSATKSTSAAKSSGPTTSGGKTSPTTTSSRPTTEHPKPTPPPAPKPEPGPRPKAAPGHTVTQNKNGSSVERGPGGRVATVRDPKRGMEVHHSLSGNRRVVVERPDHSRIVAERGGRGYVQRPYTFHGHEYARRSYYYHGAYYHAYYGRYYYRGVYVNPYYPAYYYPAAYYGWMYYPWASPAPYAWGWGANPWFGYWGAYFTPWPAYANASFWLTDYMIANSLQAAYQARVDAAAQGQLAAADPNAAPLSPEVKQMVADEVKRQIALEQNESKTGAQGEPDAASSSIQRDLTDGAQHIFVAGQDLDVTDSSGAECAVSEGDALLLAPPVAADATAVNLAVLSSKGGKECHKGAMVSVGLADLQEMQNHMRQTIDQGMQELQKKQGQGGLPPAPAAAKAAPAESAVAENAPPPPAQNEVAAQINDQSKEADKVEQEDTSSALAEPVNPGDAAQPAATPNITMGMSIDDVKAALGQPVQAATVGTKQILVYKNMKITFVDGKVTAIQ